MDKFEFVKTVLAPRLDACSAAKPRLLDVGCRDGALGRCIGGMLEVEGLDLVQNAQGTVRHVADLAKGLPFPDRSFEYVAALDVVEHLEDFEGAVDELLRVAGGALFVMLPNLAYVLFRWRFLRSGRISGKYDMALGQGRDRHRWLTILSQTDAFMRDFAKSRKLDLEIRRFNDSLKKRAFSAFCRAIFLGPQFHTWATLYVLERPRL